MKYRQGDIVVVDDGVLTASPRRGQGAVLAEVLMDSNGPQVYVGFMRPCMSSPMFVFERDIIKKGAQREQE
jgi:hypothetical protein